MGGQKTLLGSRRSRYPIREDRRHKIEVHVAGFCFRSIGGRTELLVGRRTRRRELFPGFWECGGGHVHPGESFEEALTRQYAEEFGINVRVLFPLTTYEIVRPHGPKIPGLKFVCLSVDNGSEEITLNHREFTESRWVTQRECRKLKLISGVQAQAKQAFAAAASVLSGRARARVRERIGYATK